MKIAIIPGTFFPNPGGAQVQAHNLANKICEKKHVAEILLMGKSSIKKKKYKFVYFNKIIIDIVFFLHYYAKLNLTFFLEYYLKKFIKKNNYQIWHFIFLNYKSLLLIDKLKKLNQKIIVTFQGADIQINKNITYGNRLDKKYENLLKKNINKIDFFTSISFNIFNDLKKLGLNEKKIINIPNGTILSKVIKLKKNIKKVNKNIFRIITVARYAEKKKGFDLVSKITKRLIANGLNFKWTIIGKNTSKLLENNYIKKNKNFFHIIEDINVENELYFPNSKILKYYINSDVYLNLSRIESFGITFVEALSANLPIITFDTKGANEIVSNNYNGFKVKSGNFNLLIKKIIFLSKKKNFFRNKPFRSSKKFNLDYLVQKYIKIYKKNLN